MEEDKRKPIVFSQSVLKAHSSSDCEEYACKPISINGKDLKKEVAIFYVKQIYFSGRIGAYICNYKKPFEIDGSILGCDSEDDAITILYHLLHQAYIDEEYSHLIV